MSVPRGPLAAAAIALALFATPARSQVTIDLRPTGPDYTAPNAPFTASRVTRTEIRLQTGGTVQNEVREAMTRDVDGRVFDAATPVPSDALKTGIAQYTLADPVAGTISEWRAGTTSAISVHLPPRSASLHLNLRALYVDPFAKQKLPATATVATEPLGMQEIAGLQATGTRTTTTIPANTFGNAEPVRVVHEAWISNDLHIALRELDINPLAGTRTLNTEKIRLEPSGAALFHLPPGLQIKDVSPPTSRAAAAQAQAQSQEERDARSAFFKAIDDLKAPETREAAADLVVKYAQTHPDVAVHAAHMLAIRDTHLAEAKDLADGAVARMEQATASLSLDQVTPGAFAQMVSLAIDWDTRGSVYAASGDTAAAERYFRLAWGLGGDGMSLDRVAQLEVHAGDKDAARRNDQIALSGKLDDRSRDEITRRLQRLGDTDPKPTPDPAFIALPNPGHLEGTAHIYLLFTGKAAPTAQLAVGPASFRSALSAVTTAQFPPQTPDDGPEHVLRLARLVCEKAGGCGLYFVPSWQAERPLNQQILDAGPPPPPSATN